MKREQIIAMAREAGMPMHEHNKELPFLERFAAIATAAEREECAKVCEDMAESHALVPIEKYRALFAASMIRARGNDD